MCSALHWGQMSVQAHNIEVSGRTHNSVSQEVTMQVFLHHKIVKHWCQSPTNSKMKVFYQRRDCESFFDKWHDSDVGIGHNLCRGITGRFSESSSSRSNCQKDEKLEKKMFGGSAGKHWQMQLGATSNRSLEDTSKRQCQLMQIDWVNPTRWLLQSELWACGAKVHTVRFLLVRFQWKLCVNWHWKWVSGDWQSTWHAMHG